MRNLTLQEITIVAGGNDSQSGSESSGNSTVDAFNNLVENGSFGRACDQVGTGGRIRMGGNSSMSGSANGSVEGLFVSGEGGVSGSSSQGGGIEVTCGDRSSGSGGGDN